jgi:signal transduction histidine kinase
MEIKNPRSFNVYIGFISLCGVVLAGFGLSQFFSYPDKTTFLLLVVLAVIAQLVAATATSDKVMVYEVGTAVSMAAIPLYGPEAAALVGIASGLGVWILKLIKLSWKRNTLQVLGFNTGMFSVSIFIAGWVFIGLSNLFQANIVLRNTIPWITAALVNDQLNFWILSVLIRFQQGDAFKPLDHWRENRWASIINILVAAIGGAIVAFAGFRYGPIGVATFFFPVILSSIAFGLYIRQMKAHMDNLEQIVAERTQALADLMKEKDAFLAVLTHDMKTPLTSINIVAGLLKERPDILLEKPHMADVLLRSQENLTEIVTNILDLEKLQQVGSVTLDKENVDLGLLLAHTVENTRPLAVEKNIELHFSPPMVPILLNLDRPKMERVFQNLLSNAIKYTPKDGQICVEIEPDDQFVYIHVQDNGYGIPEEDLPYVFDRYRRVKKHKGLAAGTGLGLAITKAYVEAHDGTISVQSKEKEGSKFTIKLPLALM